MRSNDGCEAQLHSDSGGVGLLFRFKANLSPWLGLADHQVRGSITREPDELLPELRQEVKQKKPMRIAE